MKLKEIFGKNLTTLGSIAKTGLEINLAISEIIKRRNGQVQFFGNMVGLGMLGTFALFSGPIAYATDVCRNIKNSVKSTGPSPE